MPLDRETVKLRLINAFDGELDDPLGAVLRELAALNEEAGLAAVAELMDAPEVGPSEQYEKDEPAAPEATPIEERKWGGWDCNVYSNPEACGLTLLAAAEEDESWQFNMVCLWVDKGSGRYFMAQDSGCSCPSPFEDVRSVSDLTEVKTRAEATSFLLSAGGDYTPSSMTSLMVAIREALSRW